MHYKILNLLHHQEVRHFRKCLSEADLLPKSSIDLHYLRTASIKAKRLASEQVHVQILWCLPAVTELLHLPNLHSPSEDPP